MSYVITELKPGGDSIDIQRIGNLLEIRAPLISVGTYQGGDRMSPEGRIIEQPKIRYSAEMVKKLTRSALGKVGDILHSDEKVDVVSFIKETDTTNPDIGYVKSVVHNQDMVQKIMSGEFNGLSMQAKVFADWNEEEQLWDATSGNIVAYGHVPIPADKTAKIESMKSIYLSHTVTSETLNKPKSTTSHSKNNKSELNMSDENISELVAQLAERDSQIKDLAKANEEKDTKLVELGTSISKLETVLLEQQKTTQETELNTILSEIVKIDEEFKSTVYLHESMGFEAKKQLLTAVLEDKKKQTKEVSLSGLPAIGSGTFNRKALNAELSGTDFLQLLKGSLY